MVESTNPIRNYSVSGAGVRLFCVSLLIFGLFSTPFFGKTLEQYREDVGHLKRDFQSMVAGERSGEDNVRIEKEILEEAGELLPPSDEIEFEGKTTPINNQWLARKIKDYRNEPADSDRKRLILTEIRERLESIELKLKQLESAKAERSAKDENKRRIATILSREEYKKPDPKKESFVQRWIRAIQEWLSNLFPRPQINPNTTTGFGTIAYVLQILVYILISAIIAFIVYKFGPLIWARVRRGDSRDDNDRIVLGEKLAPHESSKTLFNEAEKLALEGDLKAAIRKGYIALLFELSERKLLGLAKHKTNRDYLGEVRRRGELHKNMSGLTLNYERHWYGFDPVVADDWAEFREGYRKTIKTNTG